MGNALLKAAIFPKRLAPAKWDPIAENGVWLERRRAENEQTSRIAVVCFHGNMEEASDALKQWDFIHPSAFDLKAYEYPGFGHRQEELVSMEAILSDIPVMLNDLIAYDVVIVCGRSLGTFAALQLAIKLEQKCGGLMLVSPMLTAVATQIPPPFHRALWCLDMLDNESAAPKLSANIPRAITHGELDKVVPSSNGEALSKCFKPNAQFNLLQCGHNNLMHLESFKSHVSYLLDEWIYNIN